MNRTIFMSHNCCCWWYILFLVTVLQQRSTWTQKQLHYIVKETSLTNQPKQYMTSQKEMYVEKKPYKSKNKDIQLLFSVYIKYFPSMNSFSYIQMVLLYIIFFSFFAFVFYNILKWLENMKKENLTYAV